MDLPEETKKKYKDKDGIEREMDTKNLGKKAAPKTTKPDASTAEFVAQDVVSNLNEKIDELSDTINVLADENTLLRDKIAIGQWDATEIEKIDAEQTIKDLREQIRILEADNKAMRQSRDMFQNRNSELMKTVKSLQNKLKKLDPQ
jgi:chromosome segregation ATPase